MSTSLEIEAAIEAALFVSSDPLPRTKILEMFDEEDRDEVRLAIDRVLTRYRAEPGRGIFVEDVAGGVRLVTRPELHGYLRRLFEVTGRSRLSMAALETLAIVAYRQPITAPEIQDLRGVNSSGVLKTLLERRLVRIAGRKQVVGLPFLYATTREFLMHFGLGRIKDLPPLEEFEQVLGASEAGAEVIPIGPAREAGETPEEPRGGAKNGEGEESEEE